MMSKTCYKLLLCPCFRSLSFPPHHRPCLYDPVIFFPDPSFLYREMLLQIPGMVMEAST